MSDHPAFFCSMVQGASEPASFFGTIAVFHNLSIPLHPQKEASPEIPSF
jgi:hypothetical protein